MVGLAAVAVLFTLIVTARADPARHGRVHPAFTSGSIDLGKVGSYRAGLYVPTDGVVLLYLYRYQVKGSSGATVFSVAYAARSRGSLERGLIHVRFGSLGTASLRFRPNGRTRRRRLPSGCEGHRPITEYGKFVGQARFHGEKGFLDLTSRGGKGEISHSFRLSCKRADPVELPRRSLRAYVAPASFFAADGDIALLYATAHRRGRYVGVTAGHLEESPPGAEVRVGVVESRPAMAIGRYALLSGAPAGTLLTSLPGVHPASATLEPPAPFYGSGSYKEGAGAQKWSGALGIILPGLKLSLAGPEFHARLCVLSPLKARRGCNFFKAPPPPLDERPALLRMALG